MKRLEIYKNGGKGLSLKFWDYCANKIGHELMHRLDDEDTTYYRWNILYEIKGKDLN